MIDKLALATFIGDTAFIFAYDIAGAIMAFSILLNIIFFFSNMFRVRGTFLND